MQLCLSCAVPHAGRVPHAVREVHGGRLSGPVSPAALANGGRSSQSSLTPTWSSNELITAIAITFAEHDATATEQRSELRSPLPEISPTPDEAPPPSCTRILSDQRKDPVIDVDYAVDNAMFAMDAGLSEQEAVLLAVRDAFELADSEAVLVASRDELQPVDSLSSVVTPQPTQASPSFDGAATCAHGPQP